MAKKWLILGAGCILLMTMACYIPAIRGGYIWDDDFLVTNNLALRSLDGLGMIWFKPGAVLQYYPLVFTSFWLEYHLWQLDPLGYHLVNVVLHALNAILVWLVLRRLSVAGAWLAAAVFALHPVHVESVAWITERKNVLSGFFYLGAMLVYLRFYQAEPGPPHNPKAPARSAPSTPARHQWRYYAASLGLYLCAVLSKTVTCTLPAAILLLLWWQRGRIRWRDVLLLIPHFVAGVALGLTTVWLEKYVVGAAGKTWSLSIAERVLVAGRALWFYAGKLLWPRDLTFIYPRWELDAGAWWQYLFPLAAMAVFAALWFWRGRIGKAPLTAALFFAGTLTPALGFFDVYPLQYSFVADHFQYLASIGLIAVSMAGATNIFLRRAPAYKNSRYISCGVLILILGMLTWKQGHTYTDMESLWRDTISKNPRASMAYNNLGEVLFTQGKINAAIECYQKCLAIKPDHDKALNNLGTVYIVQGRLDEAIVMVEKALAISPEYAMAHSNLADIYLIRQEFDKAILGYKKALAINPKNPKNANIHNNLGLAYYNKGLLDEAIAEYTKALAISNEFGQAHYNLAVAYYYKENYKLAIAHCDKAVERGVSVYPQLLELLRPYR